MSSHHPIALRDILLLAFCFGVTDAWADQVGTPKDNKGCPFEVSVQNVDRFVSTCLADMATTEGPILHDMSVISTKAKKPGVAIGRQLDAQDIDSFNRSRHLLIQLQAEELQYSNFQRDVHIIAATLEVANLVQTGTK